MDKTTKKIIKETAKPTQEKPAYDATLAHATKELKEDLTAPKIEKKKKA